MKIIATLVFCVATTILLAQELTIHQGEREAVKKIQTMNKAAVQSRAASCSEAVVRGVVNVYVPSMVYASYAPIDGDSMLGVAFQGYWSSGFNTWNWSTVVENVYTNSYHNANNGPGRDRLNEFYVWSEFKAVRENPSFNFSCYLRYDHQAVRHSVVGTGDSHVRNEVTEDRKRCLLKVAPVAGQTTVEYAGDLMVTFIALGVSGVVDSVRVVAGDYQTGAYEENGVNVHYLSANSIGSNDEGNPFKVIFYGNDVRISTATSHRTFRAWVWSHALSWGWERPIRLMSGPSGGGGGGGIGKFGSKSTPHAFSLIQNYPNPFNSVTSIDYTVPKKANVTLKMYNMLGQEVDRLIVDEAHEPGQYTISYDASALASGIYFYRMEIGGKTVASRKMTVLK